MFGALLTRWDVNNLMALSCRQEKPVSIPSHSASILLDPATLSLEASVQSLNASFSVTLNRRAGGIHTLPNEIVNNIFLSGSLTLSTNPTTSTSPAFTLLLVCRRWRALAIALQPLWTTLDLDRCYLEQRWGQATAEILLWKFAQLCLSRTATRPLHFTFCCGSIGAPMQKLAELGATSDRWVSLTLASNTLTTILNDRKNFAGFPALRHLDMHMLSRPLGRISDFSGPIIDIDDDPDWAPFDGVALDLPALKLLRVQLRMSLSHRNDAQDGFLGLPRTIGTNITHLTIRSCAHLGTLSKRISLASAQPSALTLPFVTHLVVDGGRKHQESHHDDVWRHLAFLRLPVLAHLRISQTAPEDRDPSTNPHFGNFLSNCHQIQTLTTHQVSLKHTTALLEALKPRALTISDAFDHASSREVLCNMLKGMLKGGQSNPELDRIAVYDITSSGAQLAEDVAKLLERFARPPLREKVGDTDIPSKSIAVHSRVSPSRTFQTRIRGQAGLVVAVKLCFHLHPPRFFSQQRLATDSEEWEEWCSDSDCKSGAY
ncbi:hypothetical protein D9611_001715 [Ephemerocybe angulata]|uniref:F-box domain-containing protein n=1 Tax=Ephemerocybe angulata TaxID=980116 RepID=A0A8H5FMT0_9AGAR|nr:hypothetical protein D9611_001715 [Tulosesus angulatus]